MSSSGAAAPAARGSGPVAESARHSTYHNRARNYPRSSPRFVPRAAGHDHRMSTDASHRVEARLADGGGPVVGCVVTEPSDGS